MAGRLERCSGCGTQLLVPTEAQVVRCAVCQAVTTLWPNHSTTFNNPLVQAVQGPISSAAARFGNAVSAVMAANNIALGSGGGGSGAGGYVYYPQPRPAAATAPRPAAHGRKRAVVCGVSYIGRSNSIKGSVNDVNCMRYFLVEKMGFPVDSLFILTEYESDPRRIPTRRNILTALRWLMEDCQPGDSLVFYFSGHGSRVKDKDHDEVDGFDETLCPVDYESAGKILDDEINAIIVRPLPRAATLHAIVDACHSGTVLDLPFVCRMNREGYYTWEDQRRQSVYKGTRGGFAVSISACDDNQISADTNVLSGHILTGAMTYSFIQAAQNEPGLTYGRLLGAMRSTIREAKTGIRGKGPILSLVNRILRTELSQEPQLSSSEQFDIYSKRFVL